MLYHQKRALEGGFSATCDEMAGCTHGMSGIGYERIVWIFREMSKRKSTKGRGCSTYRFAPAIRFLVLQSEKNPYHSECFTSNFFQNMVGKIKMIVPLLILTVVILSSCGIGQKLRSETLVQNPSVAMVADEESGSIDLDKMNSAL